MRAAKSEKPTVNADKDDYVKSPVYFRCEQTAFETSVSELTLHKQAFNEFVDNKYTNRIC